MTKSVPRAVDAVARLHHAWITGLVLTLVTRAGVATAESFVFRLFRRQHLSRFLSGLSKLGLDSEPHAVACAKYHYFSNQLGGVKVEYLEESPRKAWVRYPPPRWIWDGTAICGIPSAVNRAMLRGWHAHNGVTLGNPRLGFVLTGATVDGQPGLEGYYLEHDRDLAERERLQHRPDERCPPIDAGALPALDATRWPPERAAKAYRNYAMEYVRNALPILPELLGPERARRLGGLCARQVGMQCYDAVADALEVAGNDPQAFITLMSTLLAAAGDEVEVEGGSISRTRWRLMDGLEIDAVIEAIWTDLYRGLLAAHNRFQTLESDGRGRFWVEPTPVR